MTPDNISFSEELMRVCEAFCIQEPFESYEEIKNGNINRTFKVNCTRADGGVKSFMVQRVNTYVFKDPVQVMDNIDMVTEHIRSRYPDKRVLHFHHTQDRRTYVFDDNGFWRLFNYIESGSYNATDNLNVIRNAGRAFGEFQTQLSDFDASRLHMTIPDFHNTRRRYDAFREAVKADSAGRLDEVRDMAEWLFSVEDEACRLTDLYESGALPLRVTHNDTKINNVLFDKETDEALVVIDLDTVMPGLVGHDFGDAIRFAANYVAEDCPDAERAGVNMDIFRAFTEGFLACTVDALTPNEIDTLAMSCFAMTVELAVRFLDDYLRGDPYFKINYPRHSYDRTRCQIALAKDMREHMNEMEKIVRECL